jgi:hypothetical protein
MASRIAADNFAFPVGTGLIAGSYPPSKLYYPLHLGRITSPAKDEFALRLDCRPEAYLPEPVRFDRAGAVNCR